MGAKVEGLPDLPIWVTPHPVGGISREALREYAEDAAQDVIAALTRAPRTVVGDAPAQPDVIAIRGADHADAYENFNQHCLRMRWGDGLPLTPPTRESVAKMLTGVDRRPHEVVSQIYPSSRAATVEAVAVNAVMAGCLPAYLPVVLAVLEAWDDPAIWWAGVTTTAPSAPMIVINGPIAKQLDINSKTNALGYGWRANAAIGRTIEQVWRTVGGAIPGETDMATLGSSSTFTSLVLAENEDVLDVLGWPTFAEERGFRRNANTVSVVTILWGFQQVPHYDVLTPEDAIEKLVWACQPSNLQSSGPGEAGGIFVLNPELCLIFADAGWTRADIKREFVKRAQAVWTLPLREYLERGDRARHWLKRTPEAQSWPLDRAVPLFSSDPDAFSIIVAGGPGKESQFFPVVIPPTGTFATREVHLPANWDDVVAEAPIIRVPLPDLPW